MIAGHTFDANGVCFCGRRWLDIRNTDRSEIGQNGIAHSGALTESEYQSIVARRSVEDERIEAAMRAVSAV